MVNMFLITVDKRNNDYAFMEITKNTLISLNKLTKNKNFETFISIETDEEKLIDLIEKTLNKERGN